MTLKRSLSQRIRATLGKAKAKLGGLGTEVSSKSMDLSLSQQSSTWPSRSSASLNRSNTRQNIALEGAGEFPLISNAPIYTTAMVTAASGANSVANIVYTNRRRSGSTTKGRNISIHSSVPVELDSESFKSITSSYKSYEPNDEVVMLPLGPIDMSMPSAPPNDHSISSDLPVASSGFNERPSLSINNPSLTTSSTISDSPQLPSPSNISKTSTPDPLSPLDTNDEGSAGISGGETVQVSMNPIFIKANQIDHLDKTLDEEQNDLLAEQMALNILQNISEESVDELSKLKEEISFKI